MIRGTTPTHVFTLPFNVDLIKEVKIIYSQGGKKVLTKCKADCTLNDNDITLTLTQEETLKFSCLNDVEIQLKILTHADKVIVSQIEAVDVERCLDSEVLV